MHRQRTAQTSLADMNYILALVFNPHDMEALQPTEGKREALNNASPMAERPQLIPLQVVFSVQDLLQLLVCGVLQHPAKA